MQTDARPTWANQRPTRAHYRLTSAFIEQFRTYWDHSPPLAATHMTHYHSHNPSCRLSPSHHHFPLTGDITMAFIHPILSHQRKSHTEHKYHFRLPPLSTISTEPYLCHLSLDCSPSLSSPLSLGLRHWLTGDSQHPSPVRM